MIIEQHNTLIICIYVLDVMLRVKVSNLIIHYNIEIIILCLR